MPSTMHLIDHAIHLLLVLMLIAYIWLFFILNAHDPLLPLMGYEVRQTVIGGTINQVLLFSKANRLYVGSGIILFSLGSYLLLISSAERQNRKHQTKQK